MSKLTLVLVVLFALFIFFMYQQKLEQFSFSLKVENIISKHPAATGMRLKGLPRCKVRLG